MPQLPNRPPMHTTDSTIRHPTALSNILLRLAIHIYRRHNLALRRRQHHIEQRNRTRRQIRRLNIVEPTIRAANIEQRVQRQIMGTLPMTAQPLTITVNNRVIDSRPHMRRQRNTNRRIPRTRRHQQTEQRIGLDRTPIPIRRMTRIPKRPRKRETQIIADSLLHRRSIPNHDVTHSDGTRAPLSDTPQTVLD